MRKLLKEMFGGLEPWGRFWLFLGISSLICAGAMSFAFGSEISLKHALFLTCLTAVAAFLPDAAYFQWEQGRKIVASILAVIAIPTLCIEFYTHAGYTAGLRGSNIEIAMVQNTKWSGSQEAVTDGKTNLALWRKQLAELKEKHAWAATVKAEGLRAQLVTAQKAIDLEAARKGCKTKCLAEMEKKADIENRIAIAEERENLERRIEATQRLLNQQRDVAAAVEHKSSAVDHQNRFLAKAVALVGTGSLKPTEFMTEGAEQSVNLAMAFAGTGLAPLALFIAGLYRRPEWSAKPAEPLLRHTPVHPRDEERSASTGNSHAHEITEGTGYLRPSVGRGTHTHETNGATTTLNMFGLANTDEILKRWAADARVGNLLKAA